MKIGVMGTFEALMVSVARHWVAFGGAAVALGLVGWIAGTHDLPLAEAVRPPPAVALARFAITGLSSAALVLLFAPRLLGRSGAAGPVVQAALLVAGFNLAFDLATSVVVPGAINEAPGRLAVLVFISLLGNYLLFLVPALALDRPLPEALREAVRCAQARFWVHVGVGLLVVAVLVGLGFMIGLVGAVLARFGVDARPAVSVLGQGMATTLVGLLPLVFIRHLPAQDLVRRRAAVAVFE